MSTFYNRYNLTFSAIAMCLPIICVYNIIFQCSSCSFLVARVAIAILHLMLLKFVKYLVLINVLLDYCFYF